MMRVTSVSTDQQIGISESSLQKIDWKDIAFKKSRNSSSNARSKSS